MKRAALCALALVVAPSAARADAEDELGLGVVAAARAGAVVAVPTGWASTHYDPALLSTGDDTRPGFVEAELGVVYAAPFAHVTGADGTPLAGVAPVHETLAVAGGLRFDLGRSLFGIRGLHMGVSLFTPVDHLLFWETRPDDYVQWMTLGDGTQHLVAAAGLGYRITDWLSVGVSVRTTFVSQLQTTAAVRDVMPRTLPDGTMVIDVGTRLGEHGVVQARVLPIVGIAVTPTPELRFGLVWRSGTMLDDWGWSRVQGVPGFGDIGYVHHFAHYFRPHEVELGAALHPTRELELSADLSWQHWSEGLTASHLAYPLQFGDTLVPSGSVRYTPKPGLDLFAGYSFVRAPFANFGGPTNILTGDTHVASVGASADLGVLAPSWHVPVTVRASFRLNVLVSGTEVKDFRFFEDDAAWTRNAGFPSYQYGAIVPSMQLSAGGSW